MSDTDGSNVAYKQERALITHPPHHEPVSPVTICVLGDFCVKRGSQVVPLRTGGKSEVLLAYLAVEQGRPVPRTVLVKVLWPDAELPLASHSLSNHVLALQKLLAPALQNAQPLVAEGRFLRLNVMAGITVDVACFDDLAQSGDQHVSTGTVSAAMMCYTRAVALYRGDLCLAVDIRMLMERERLRARALTILSRLADFCFRNRDDDTCLAHLLHLLALDPCHEDAHRLTMRCYLRRGQRGAALRQYHLCADLLRTKFGAVPEPATIELFAQIRDEPNALDTNWIET